jgi:hypothetical protein
VGDSVSGGFSQQGIEQAGHCASRAFLVYFFNFFYILFLCIYLIYNTVDSIFSQLAILHMPEVIYMPFWNSPEHVHVIEFRRETSIEITLEVLRNSF